MADIIVDPNCEISQGKGGGLGILDLQKAFDAMYLTVLLLNQCNVKLFKISS